MSKKKQTAEQKAQALADKAEAKRIAKEMAIPEYAKTREAISLSLRKNRDAASLCALLDLFEQHPDLKPTKFERGLKTAAEAQITSAAAKGVDIETTVNLGDGITMEFIWIPEADDKTPGFWIGKNPVTQAQYRQVMGTNPAFYKDHEDHLDFPVESVNWYDCQAFVKQLANIASNQENQGCPIRFFTLPTGDQWRHACAAFTKTPFYWGRTCNATECNCDGNYPYGTTKKGPYLARPSAVGSYPPNQFGLNDMCGNVWEWCALMHNGKQTPSFPVERAKGGNELMQVDPTVMPSASPEGSVTFSPHSSVAQESTPQTNPVHSASESADREVELMQVDPTLAGPAPSVTDSAGPTNQECEKGHSLKSQPGGSSKQSASELPEGEHRESPMFPSGSHALSTTVCPEALPSMLEQEGNTMSPASELLEDEDGRHPTSTHEGPHNLPRAEKPPNQDAGWELPPSPVHSPSVSELPEGEDSRVPTAPQPGTSPALLPCTRTTPTTSSTAAYDPEAMASELPEDEDSDPLSIGEAVRGTTSPGSAVPPTATGTMPVTPAAAGVSELQEGEDGQHPLAVCCSVVRSSNLPSPADTSFSPPTVIFSAVSELQEGEDGPHPCLTSGSRECASSTPGEVSPGLTGRSSTMQTRQTGIGNTGPVASELQEGENSDPFILSGSLGPTYQGYALSPGKGTPTSTVSDGASELQEWVGEDIRRPIPQQLHGYGLRSGPIFLQPKVQVWRRGARLQGDSGFRVAGR